MEIADLENQMDEMCEMFDDLFSQEMWEEADQLILRWNPETDSSAFVIGILTITGPNMVGLTNAKKMPNRQIFFDKAYQRFYNEDHERAERLLKGLRLEK